MKKRSVMYLGMALAMLWPSVALAAENCVDTGTTAWMLISTGLVLLMVPGLAMFYGGLVRAKNVLGTMMHSFVAMALIGVLWPVCGYALAFGNSILGGVVGWNSDYFLLRGIDNTITNGVPEYILAMFQGKFAIITPALISGALAERVYFRGYCLFIVLWFLAVYVPLCHWIWAPDGWLYHAGASGVIDLAGGLVIHVSAGISALVVALFLGPRRGYPKIAMHPNNLVMTMMGAGLLWVGWFGFNAGSNLEANGTTAMVFFNTMVATGAATLAWVAAEWIMRGKPSMLGAASGAIAGLVAITPACGWAGPMGSIVLGLVAGGVCFWSVTTMKRSLGYDDSLDVFGVHGVGGIIGALGTAIVASPALGGAGVYDYVTEAVGDYDMKAQFISQAWGVGVVLVWSGLVSLIGYKVVDLLVGLRVTEEVERQGLDIVEHGETAYHS